MSLAKNSVLSLLAVAGFAATSFAQEAAEPAPPGGNLSTSASKGFSYSASPESATLPEGVARVWLPYQMSTGTSSFDKDGNKSDSAAKVTATGGAVVVEYGIVKNVSLQIKVDYRKSVTSTLTDSYRASTIAAAIAANKSATYTSATKTLSTATGVAITDQASLQTALQTAIVGGCVKAGVGTTAACSAAYSNGTLKSNSLPSSITDTFGAGSASVSSKDYVTAAGPATETKIVSGITDSANSKLDAANVHGNFTVGDTLIGALYTAIPTETIGFAIGAGIRVPTGNHNSADIYEDAFLSTRRAYELGIRTDLDYLPIDWFMVSWQNQLEAPLMSTKHNVGDTEYTVRRAGIRNVGFFYLKPSLEVASESLKPVKTNVGITYDYDSATCTKIGSGDESCGDHQSVVYEHVGLGYSFLRGMGVPVELDMDYDVPFKGKNVAVASTKTTFTLKAYNKF